MSFTQMWRISDEYLRFDKVTYYEYVYMIKFHIHMTDGVVTR